MDKTRNIRHPKNKAKCIWQFHSLLVYVSNIIVTFRSPVDKFYSFYFISTVTHAVLESQLRGLMLENLVPTHCSVSRTAINQILSKYLLVISCRKIQICVRNSWIWPYSSKPEDISSPRWQEGYVCMCRWHGVHESSLCDELFRAPKQQYYKLSSNQSHSSRWFTLGKKQHPKDCQI